jgi:multidrug resistance protein
MEPDEASTRAFSRRRLATQMVLISLIMAGNGLLSPVMSLYAVQFGVGGALIGMVVTLFGVGRLVANMPAGLLSQRLGYRPLMIAGPLFMSIGSFGAALTHDFTMLLIWRFIQGLGSGVYMTSAGAALIEIAAPGERGKIMSYYQGAQLLGSSIGPAVGGFLAEHFGLSSPFLAYGAVGIVASAVAALSFQDMERPPPPAPGEVVSLGGLMRQLPFLLLCLLYFSIFFTRTAAQWQTIPLLGHEHFGLSVDVLGLALTVMALANFSMLPWSGRMIDTFGPRRITICAVSLTGISLTLIAAAPHVALFWVGMVLLGIASGFSSPAVAACIGEVVPRRLYGPAMGTLRVCGDCGFIVGPLIVGSIADLTPYGNSGGLFANAALVLFAATVFGLGNRRARAA